MGIRTVVFPVAGFGTRFLPASKAVPKEMLPVMDRPLIQWAVEEAVAAGATRMVFVVNRHKHAIQDHFEPAFELETKLAQSGRHELLKAVQATAPKGVEMVFVIQAEPRGLGHAVLCAEPAVGRESFAVILPDDFIYSPQSPGAMAQMVAEHARHGGSVIAVEPIDPQLTERYGIVRSDAETGRIHAMVEKPKPEAAPSNLAIVGRYVLSGEVFDLLRATTPGAGGEIQLTDAIAGLLGRDGVFAYRFHGKRFDCGSKLGLVQATLRLALDDASIGQSVREYMAQL